MNANDDRNKQTRKTTSSRVDHCNDFQLLCTTKWKFKSFFCFVLVFSFLSHSSRLVYSVCLFVSITSIVTTSGSFFFFCLSSFESFFQLKFPERRLRERAIVRSDLFINRMGKQILVRREAGNGEVDEEKGKKKFCSIFIQETLKIH